jgi:hypothetical protein
MSYHHVARGDRRSFRTQPLRFWRRLEPEHVADAFDLFLTL